MQPETSRRLPRRPVDEAQSKSTTRAITCVSSLSQAAFKYYPRLRAVEEYVRTHLSDDVRLAEVSQAAGLEKKYFSTYFHSKVGMSFSGWLRLVRVNRAKDLMEGREASIPQLAFAAGFRDVRTFERAFKRIVGMTPVAYRLRVRPESRELSE